MGLNHIDIQGRLTKDPEKRTTGSGKTVTSFTIAVDRNMSQGVTDFFDCVSWGTQGDFVAKHFMKGKMILISGRLQKRSWNDKEGNKRETAEIVTEDVYFCDSKKDDQKTVNSFAMLEGEDSDLPF